MESSNDSLSAIVDRPKRQTVATACERCRHKRTKCDGVRPCGGCVKRKQECKYAADEGETPRDARKRKFKELSSTASDFEQLFSSLASEDERTAEEIFRSVRQGKSLETILAMLRKQRRQHSPELNLYELRQQAFIITLAQSTVSSYAIVQVAAAVLASNAQLTLPAIEVIREVQDCFITPHVIDMMIREVNPTLPPKLFLPCLVLQPQPGGPNISDGFDSGPPCWASAKPWTNMVSDHAFSHLLSIFFRMPNTFWRWVDESVFMAALRSGQEDSPYCSSFLVHAMLGHASTYTEIEDAFAEPGRYLTRGEHFYEEALRQWRFEQTKTCVATISGCLILHLGLAMNAKDEVGYKFLETAISLNRSISIPDPPPGQLAPPEVRARRSIAATVSFVERSWHFSVLTWSHTFSNTPEVCLEGILPDTVVQWVCYPLTQTPQPYRANLQMRARGRLLLHLNHVSDFVLNDIQTMTRSQIHERAATLSSAVSEWNANLPAALMQRKGMPWGLFELHANYHCMMMSLSDAASKAMSQSDSDGPAGISIDQITIGNTQDCSKQALRHADHAASLCEDFRQTYGLKMIPPFLMHCAASASFVFLEAMRHDLHAAPSERFYNAAAESAFEECFRFLLAAGLQRMLPRGIVRMIYHTARRLGLRLPRQAQNMLQMIADAAWRPSDVRRLSSYYPNWLAIADQGCRLEGPKMDDCLRRWEVDECGQ